MSNPFDPPADDANPAPWASSETETVTEAPTDAGRGAVTEPETVTESTDGSGSEPTPDGPPMSPAAAMSRSSASHGKTVALVASVAALAGLAGGFAIRAAHGSTGSNSTQLGSTGDQGRGSAVTGSDDSDTGGVFAGRGATGRSGAGAVPSPFRGGGQSSTSSGGS